jgi:hypothetical protein
MSLCTVLPYRLSFTFGGLLFPETVEIAHRHRVIQDWNALKAEATEGKLLRKTRAASRYRYFSEIRDRLNQAWPFEVELIANEDLGARYAALALCCRYYRLVGDFIRDVVRDKVAMRDELLGYSDYFHFFEKQSLQHSELAGLSETTKAKLRQVTFRMLAEGLVIEKGTTSRIVIPKIPESLVNQYRQQGDTLSLEYLLYRPGA